MCKFVKKQLDMKNVYKALAGFQQEVPVIHKGTKGYGYSYADLPTIFEVINPLLKKHGLGFTQLMNDESIKTIIFHVESGETLEANTRIPSDVVLKGMNPFQVLGSAVTYIRRYALSSALGLITDKDTDAHGQQKPKLTKDQFEKTLTAPSNQIQAVIDKFDLDDSQLKQLKAKL